MLHVCSIRSPSCPVSASGCAAARGSTGYCRAWTFRNSRRRPSWSPKEPASWWGNQLHTAAMAPCQSSLLHRMDVCTGCRWLLGSRRSQHRKGNEGNQLQTSAQDASLWDGAANVRGTYLIKILQELKYSRDHCAELQVFSLLGQSR